VADAVIAFANENQNRFQGEVKIATRDNTAQFIKMRIQLLGRNAAFGWILVLIILTTFLNFRVAVWAALGVPISLFGAFIVIRLIGYTINEMTLFGLIVILGMIVDDAIIIGENIYRRYQQGSTPREAAIDGADEVVIPVMATILTTLAAFAPLAFVSGDIGKMFRPLTGAVLAALMISVIEAFCVLPSHLFGSMKAIDKKKKQESKKISTNPSPFNKFFSLIGSAKEYFLDVKMTNAYEKVLRLCISWRYVSVAFSVAVLFMIMVMLQNGRPPTVMLQEMDGDLLVANLEMVAGTAVDDTKAALIEIENVCMNDEEINSQVRSVFSMLGQQVSMGSGGHQQGADSDPATIGQVLIELRPAEDRTIHSKELMSMMRSRIKRSATVSSLEFLSMDGRPTGADFEIKVRGDDLESLNVAVEYVKQKLGSYQGVVGLRDDMSAGKLEALINVNPIGHMLGLDTRDLAFQMRNAIFGAEAQTLQRGREEVKVRVRLKKDARDSIGDIESMKLATPQGGRVPFGEVATLYTGRGFDAISRIDRKRTVTIEADLDENLTNVPANKISAELQGELENIGTIFPGISVRQGGEMMDLAESGASLKKGFLFAMFAIYGILCLVFSSYTQPIIIMFAVPFGLIGMVSGHIVMGFPLTVMSQIGFIALTGIVVNDSLILIDFINRARKRGVSAYDAIINGGRLRLRPILLTSITTIGGLLPLLTERSFGAQMLIPMGISISYGLGFATVLTLLILPCLYLILDDVQNMLGNIWKSFLRLLYRIWNLQAPPETDNLDVEMQSTDEIL